MHELNFNVFLVKLCACLAGRQAFVPRGKTSNHEEHKETPHKEHKEKTGMNL